MVLEVWDSVSEGDPIMLGAAELPSELLRDLLLSHDYRDSDDFSGVGDYKNKPGQRSLKGSRRPHSLDLHLGLPKKQSLAGKNDRSGRASAGLGLPKKQSSVDKNDGNEERTPSTGTKTVPGSSTSGTLSVSLERVSPEVVPGTGAKRVPDTKKSAGGEEQKQEGMVLPGEETNHDLSETKNDGTAAKEMGTTGATLSEVYIPKKKGRSLAHLLFCLRLGNRENSFMKDHFFIWHIFVSILHTCVEISAESARGQESSRLSARVVTSTLLLICDPV